MYLLELAAQNVRGLSPTVRAALKPGYLLLKTPSGGPAPLSGLIAALCYPDGRGGDAMFAAQGQRGKVGLTVLGSDQTTYRLLRELGGPGSLSRLNKQSGAFEVVTEDSSDISQFLRGQVGFPSRGAFEQLFAFNSAQLPSRRPKKAAAVPLGASGPKASLSGATLPSAMAVTAASDVGAAEEKAQQLEDELRLSREVEDLQFKLDGIASQVFELESKLKGGEGIRAALEAAQRDYERAPSLEQYGLPADIVQRAEAYPQLEQKRDEQLAKLEADGPIEEDHVPYVEPLTKDQRFLGSVAAGVLFLGLGLFMEGMARYVALLDIPAFSFAALLALRFVDDKEHAQRTSRRGGMRQAREKKIRDDFDAEARIVKAAMGTLQVTSASELVDLLSQKQLLLEKVEEYRQQLEAYEQDPEYRGALAAAEQLRAQQEAMNEELTQKGSYVRDFREVERELNRVRESIQLAKAGPAPAAATPAAAEVATPGEPLEDPSPQLLSGCTDLLQTDVPTLAGLAMDRIAQYLAALTDRRLVGVEFDTTGKATAFTAQGQRVPAPNLPPRDADVLYLAIRLTLIERVSARTKLPVIIEDALPVDDAKHALMARMVKHLGTLTQVLHVSAHPAYLPMADAQIAL